MFFVLVFGGESIFKLESRCKSGARDSISELVLSNHNNTRLAPLCTAQLSIPVSLTLLYRTLPYSTQVMGA